MWSIIWQDIYLSVITCQRLKTVGVDYSCIEFMRDIIKSMHTHTHTHTHIYIYIYIYIGLFISICLSIYLILFKSISSFPYVSSIIVFLSFIPSRSLALSLSLYIYIYIIQKRMSFSRKFDLAKGVTILP